MTVDIYKITNHS